MEQFVILLVLGAVGLVKWLMEKSAEQRAQRENEGLDRRLDEIGRAQPPAPAPPRPAVRPIDSFPRPDVAARKLREALGLPPESEVQLPIPPRPAFPRPRPKILSEEVVAGPRADLERRLVATPRPVSAPLPSLPKEISLPGPIADAGSVSRSGLEELLRSRDGLRRAILVQEVLGTPKGLVF